MGQHAAVIAAATVAMVIAAAEARAGVECITDWSDARAIVKKEGLTTVEVLVRQAPDRLGGEIVRSTLCRDGAHFTYRLIIRDSGGTIKVVTVDARDPFKK